MKNIDNTIWLYLGEGDYITNASLEFQGDNALIHWDLLKADGTIGYQNFWIDANDPSLNNLNLDYLKGEMIRSVSLFDENLQVIFGNGSHFQMKLLIK